MDMLATRIFWHPPPSPSKPWQRFPEFSRELCNPPHWAATNPRVPGSSGGALAEPHPWSCQCCLPRARSLSWAYRVRQKRTLLVAWDPPRAQNPTDEMGRWRMKNMAMFQAGPVPVLVLLLREELDGHSLRFDVPHCLRGEGAGASRVKRPRNLLTIDT